VRPGKSAAAGALRDLAQSTSVGRNCDSNWARVYTYGGYDATLAVVACQNDDGSCSQPDPYVRYDSAAYSDMVVGTHVVCATGTITWYWDQQVYRGQANSCQ
jgi:hypothetical protein